MKKRTTEAKVECIKCLFEFCEEANPVVELSSSVRVHFQHWLQLNLLYAKYSVHCKESSYTHEISHSIEIQDTQCSTLKIRNATITYGTGDWRATLNLVFDISTIEDLFLHTPPPSFECRARKQWRCGNAELIDFERTITEMSNLWWFHVEFIRWNGKWLKNSQ